MKPMSKCIGRSCAFYKTEHYNCHMTKEIPPPPKSKEEQLDKNDPNFEAYLKDHTVKELAQYVNQNYVSKAKVLEAIRVDEEISLREISRNMNVEEATTELEANLTRNQLRESIKNQLGLDGSGDG